MAGGTEVTYVIRLQEKGAEPGWLSMPGVRMLSTAENKAAWFHRAGYTVEIDEVTTRMVRRWHDPDNVRWYFDKERSQWTKVKV